MLKGVSPELISQIKSIYKHIFVKHKIISVCLTVPEITHNISFAEFVTCSQLSRFLRGLLSCF